MSDEVAFGGVSGRLSATWVRAVSVALVLGLIAAAVYAVVRRSQATSPLDDVRLRFGSVVAQGLDSSGRPSSDFDLVNAGRHTTRVGLPTLRAAGVRVISWGAWSPRDVPAGAEFSMTGTFVVNCAVLAHVQSAKLELPVRSAAGVHHVVQLTLNPRDPVGPLASVARYCAATAGSSP